MADQFYIPTVESCWDYGISRNAPLLPFIGSTLPYSFLRGVQYDTKVFKLSEILANGVNGLSSLYTSATSRNEVIFHLIDTESQKNILEKYNKLEIIPKNTGGGVINDVVQKNVQNLKKTYFEKEELHIAVENDSDVSISISNKWSAGEDILTQAIQGVAEIAKNIGEIGRTLGYGIGSKELVETLGVPFSPARYKGTDFGTITLNFNLFTRNNYIRDIFIPLEILKSLCLPSKSSEAQSLHDKAIKLINNQLAKTGSSIEKIKNIPENIRSPESNAILKSVELLESGLRAMSERFKIVNAPPSFRVSHSANLFFLKKAVITNFTYKPAGPWVRVEYDGLFSKVFGIAGQNSSIGTALDRLLRDEYVKFAHYPDHTYPSRITCSMTLQETDFITLEDYTENLTQKENLVSTTIETLGTLGNPGSLAAAQIAGGIAQNLDVLTPNIPGAGDLLSGGRWVPPGETMSGIPGFL